MHFVLASRISGETSIAVHTNRHWKLKFRKINNLNRFSNGRSAGVFARGGTQQPFRTQLDLFQLYDGSTSAKILNPGSVVQLGDELMLRAHVRAGDGTH